MSAARSSGSARRSPPASRFSASASARRCWRATSAIASARTLTGRWRSATTRSARPAHGRAAWPLFPQKVYQWHREGFDLPAGATLLAEGDAFEAQAFVYGRNAYGLQFHPEVTYSMMCRWTTLAAERLTAPNACPRDRHFRDWYAHDGTVARWLAAFLRQWVAGGHVMPAMRVHVPEARH